MCGVYACMYDDKNLHAIYGVERHIDYSMLYDVRFSVIVIGRSSKSKSEEEKERAGQKIEKSPKLQVEY